MPSVNEKYYDNLSKAVAFVIDFDFMVYSYDNVGWRDYEREVCTRCRKTEQYSDFLAPKSNCKRDFAMLQSYYYGVSVDIHDALIRNFDISEDDFRPVRSKKGEVVYYQLVPSHVMLPITSVNRIRQLKPCTKCGSVQYRIKEYENSSGNLYYHITKEALDTLHDLNRTREEFDMFFPRYVVSRRVYDFLSEKYPRMRMCPMFLE